VNGFVVGLIAVAAIRLWVSLQNKVVAGQIVAKAINGKHYE
jgi:hypothetical protein